VVRLAGALAALEATVGLVVAVVLVIRGLTGHDEHKANGYGTAGVFVILAGAVLAAGIALLRGRRGGRSVVFFAQLLLLPVIWALLTGSHRPLVGALVAIVVLAVLGLMFTPAFNRWMAGQYAADDD
jgi:hypothetical protein